MKNTGKREGTETVQMYMQDVAASLVRPVKELKGFAKCHLQPGEEKEVEMSLQKRDMGFYDNEGEYRMEDGAFRLYMGGNSEDCLAKNVEVTMVNNKGAVK